MSDSREDLVDDQNVHFKLERVCFRAAGFLCTLLLVACITLAVLYSQAVDDEATTHGVVTPGKKYKICNDDHCFDLGKEIVHSMNQTADPCQDFYTYACGGWQQRHPLKKGQKFSSRASSLGMKNLNIVKQALEKATVNYSKNLAVMKTAHFYNSCMNTSAIASQELRPLFNLIAEYGGWSVTDNYDRKVTIATRIGKAALDLNVNSLFGVSTFIDPYNSSRTILKVDPASLTFGRQTYLNASNKAMVEKVAKAYGALFGGNDSYIRLMAIYDFEVKLAKISSGKTPEAELDEFVGRSIRDKTPLPDIRMTITEFCKSTGFLNTDFKNILKIIYGQTFSGDEKLLVTNVDYFKRLYAFYKETVAAGDVSIVADYIMWRVVDKYLGALSSNYSNTSMMINKSSSASPRWSQCIADIMLKPFGMTLGLLYVNANFDDNSKKTVEEMTDDIRASFIGRLQSQTWMDSETKEKAKEKALAIRVSIGYPTYIKDPQKLEYHYKSLKVTDDFFTNYKFINHFLRRKEVESYGKPVDKDSWLYSPVEVNGYYAFKENRIVYLAGIIQPPYYNPDYPRYMKYGAIGAVIGHEITHGFDGTGRMFDKYGNLHNWWSNSADTNFNEKSSCLVKQYNKYKVFDKKINGTLTLNENIADNGGIKIAYDAYQRWAAQNGTEKILPGLELNPDQLFFVGFAQIWCSAYSRQGALHQLKTDGHSYNKYRVIGSLSNFDKFSQAFKCPANSPMNPRAKCAVW